MMKLKSAFIILLILFFGYGSALSADWGTAATDILTRYLHALTRGDTDEAKSLMGGTLLQRRQRLFSNPDYRQYLVNKYASAHFELLDMRYPDSHTINVSVQTELDNGDRFIFIYTITRGSDQSIRIVAESRPENMRKN